LFCDNKKHSLPVLKNNIKKNTATLSVGFNSLADAIGSWGQGGHASPGFSYDASIVDRA